MEGDNNNSTRDDLASFPNLTSESLQKNLTISSRPNAFAWTYPWPPLPSNLNKRRVFRQTNGHTLNMTPPTIFDLTRSDSTKPIPPSPLSPNASQIELAIYWDRRNNNNQDDMGNNLETIKKEGCCRGQSPEVMGQSVCVQTDKYEVKEPEMSEIGVQVDEKRVLSAALKSNYLCPLHGQYQKKIANIYANSLANKQREELLLIKQCPRLLRSWSSDNVNRNSVAQANRQRALNLKKSTELILNKKKEEEFNEVQCHPKGEESSGVYDGRHESIVKAQRRISKSASAKFYASEYKSHFRNPGAIQGAESRLLRNKILSNSLCFTKQSILL